MHLPLNKACITDKTHLQLVRKPSHCIDSIPTVNSGWPIAIKIATAIIHNWFDVACVGPHF